MNDLDEVRQAFPEFADLSDEDLAYGLKQTHFKDMPDEEYYSQIGMQAPGMAQEQSTPGFRGVGEDVLSGILGAIPKAGEFIVSGAKGLYDFGGGDLGESNTLADHLREMVGIKTANQRERAYPADRFAKVIASSLGKGAQGLANVPSNAVQYAKDKDFLPEGFPSLQAPESVRNFDFDELAGIEGERPGDIIPGMAQLLPALLATGGNVPAAIGLQSVGENENPIENMLAGSILQAGAKHGPKAISNAPKVIGKGVEAVKGVTESLIPEKYSQAKTLNKASDIVTNDLASIKKDYNTALLDKRLPPSMDVSLNPEWVQEFRKGAPGFSVNLDKAIESGTLYDLHQAATDLGDYARNVKERKTKASPKVQQTAITAKKIKSQIEKVIDDALDTQPGLKDIYRNADKKYEAYKKIVPKKLEDILKEYKEGQLFEKDAVRAFKGKDAAKFRKKYAKELPGIETAPHETSVANIPGARQGINVLQRLLGEKR